MELVARPLVHKRIVGSDPDIVVGSRYEVQVSRKSSKILKIIVHIVAIGRSAGCPGKNEEPNGGGAAYFIAHRAHVGIHACDPSESGSCPPMSFTSSIFSWKSYDTSLFTKTQRTCLQLGDKEYRLEPHGVQDIEDTPLTLALSHRETVSQCHSEALAEESLVSNLLIL